MSCWFVALLQTRRDGPALRDSSRCLRLSIRGRRGCGRSALGHIAGCVWCVRRLHGSIARVADLAQVEASRVTACCQPNRGSSTHPAWGWGSLVGAAGGILSGFFGVGGATIAPPLLTTFYGFKQAAAQGLALALVAPGAIVGLATYAKAGAVSWPQGLALAVGGTLLVSRGVSLAYRLPERKLKLSFCGLLVVTAAIMIASSLA